MDEVAFGLGFLAESVRKLRTGGEKIEEVVDVLDWITSRLPDPN